MDIKVIMKEDVELYWKARLNALKEYPISFGGSYEETVLTPIEQVKESLSTTEDNYILGAFTDEDIIGIVGLRREQLKKLKHKATIWGMYVSQDKQNLGIGRKLLSEVIQRSKTINGLEQLNLYVSAINKPAKRLYSSFGFKTYGLEKKALKIDDKYYDEELMVLYL